MENELDLEELIKTNKLTPKQEKFCQEYILCLNATLAYERAYGVEKSTATKIASRLMGNDGVKMRIRELQKQMAEEFNVTKEYLLNTSIWVINEAMKGQKQFIATKDGVQPTGEMTHDMRAINDAIKNISAITGLNVQKVQASVDAEVKTTTTVEDMAREILGG